MFVKASTIGKAAASCKSIMYGVKNIEDLRKLNETHHVAWVYVMTMCYNRFVTSDLSDISESDTILEFAIDGYDYGVHQVHLEKPTYNCRSNELEFGLLGGTGEIAKWLREKTICCIWEKKFATENGKPGIEIIC